MIGIDRSLIQGWETVNFMIMTITFQLTLSNLYLSGPAIIIELKFVFVYLNFTNAKNIHKYLQLQYSVNIKNLRSSFRMSKKINGLKMANQLLTQVNAKIAKTTNSKKLPQHLKAPRLGIILVGNNPASLSYIKRKRYFASKASVKTRIFHLKDVENQSTIQASKELQQLIKKLNADPKYHGILLQLPLHQKLSQEEDKFLDLIDPRKDVDCLSSQNKQKFQEKKKKAQIIPCVVKGVLKMLQEKQIKIKDKNILLIGQGKLVGRPLKTYLSNQCKNLIVADANTPSFQLINFAGNADIIISATGKQDILPQSSLKEDCVIIDIGVSPDPQKPGKVRGDFREDIKNKICSFYSPVPKGIGPVVVASLIENVFIAWKSQSKIK